jgi:uncharacterized YigZ family protein
MASPYHRIPGGIHRTDIVVVNSRFITTIAPAAFPEDAKRFIAGIRAEMPDASHHVYGFRAGYGNSVVEGMSDDGEPGGTAGPPTLAVLRGADIGDIVLVTTRYFGGTKLGTGGLVRAYTEAAQTALASLPTILKAPKEKIGIDLPYHLYESVKRLIQQHHGTLDEEVFADVVTLFVTFLKDDVAAFTAQLTTLSAGQISPVLLGEA